MYTATAALLLAAFSAGWLLMTPSPEPQDTTVLPQPRPLPDFELLDQDGETWNHESLQGQWHVLFFGFTNCPDVCPITLQALSRAMKHLDEQGHKRPQVAFVTVDPERDGVAEVAEYAQYFDPAFNGITGELEQIDAFAHAAGIGVRRHPPDDDGHYMVDHTSSLVIINPEGRIAGYITPPLQPETIASDLAIIMNRGWRDWI